MKYFILSLLFITTTAFGGWFDSELEKQNQADINIIKNSGAENGLSGWSEIGTGSFILSTSAANVARGTSAFAMDMGSGSDSLESSGYLIPNDIAGTLCIAEMKYKGAGTADIIFTVEDADNTALGSTTIVNAETNFRRAFFTFICPAAGGTTNEKTLNVKLSTAGNPATIIFDSVFVGVKSLTEGAAGGWKVYDESTVTITSTANNYSVSHAEFLPYKDPVTNNWRLRFNFQSIFDNDAGRIAQTVSIAGVTFKTGGRQQVSHGNSFGSNYLDNRTLASFASGSTGDLIVTMDGTGSTNNHYISGDVALDSKPTWADFDGTVNLLNNSVIYSNAKASFYVSTNAVLTTIDTVSQSIPFNSSVYNEGYTLDPSGYITILADGKYRISGQRSMTAVHDAATRTAVYVNTVARKTGADRPTGVSRSNYNFTLDLLTGDKIVVRALSIGTVNTVLGGADESYLNIERIPDVSSESPLGFGLADADNAGLVTKKLFAVYGQWRSTCTVSPCTSFTSNGDVDVTNVTRTGLGVYRINFTTPWLATDQYACTVNNLLGSNDYCTSSTGGTADYWVLNCFDDTGAAFDTRASFVCMGDSY